jgi:hypothetical protein
LVELVSRYSKRDDLAFELEHARQQLAGRLKRGDRCPAFTEPHQTAALEPGGVLLGVEEAEPVWHAPGLDSVEELFRLPERLSARFSVACKGVRLGRTAGLTPNRGLLAMRSAPSSNRKTGQILLLVTFGEFVIQMI